MAVRIFFHIAVGGYDHGFEQVILFIDPAEECQSIHFWHIDVAQYDVDIAVLRQLFEGMFAVDGEYKFILVVAYLCRNFCLMSTSKICFVVYYKYLDIRRWF